MLSHCGRPDAELQVGEQQESVLIPFACSTCSSPAVTLPEEFHDRAPVLCQGCGGLITTWGLFKQRTTQVILSEIRQGTGSTGFGSDPLDDSLMLLEGMASVELRS